MSTILPQGESLRRAVKWIAEQLKAHPDANPLKYVNEAISQFDLTPKDSDFLINMYRKKE